MRISVYEIWEYSSKLKVLRRRVKNLLLLGGITKIQFLVGVVSNIWLIVHVDFCKSPNIGHMVMTLNHCISSSYSLTWHKNHEWGRGVCCIYICCVWSGISPGSGTHSDLERIDSWCSTIYSRRALIFDIWWLIIDYYRSVFSVVPSDSESCEIPDRTLHTN